MRNICPISKRQPSRPYGTIRDFIIYYPILLFNYSGYVTSIIKEGKYHKGVNKSAWFFTEAIEKHSISWDQFPQVIFSLYLPKINTRISEACEQGVKDILFQVGKNLKNLASIKFETRELA